MKALLFPGQGSQLVGMGLEFYNKFEIVQNIFKEADEKLGFRISKIILEGPETDLKLTKNTQPAILTISYSIFKLIKEEFGIKLENVKYFAGHSLGEYSALACAESITFEQTVKLLKIRGKAMRTAVPKGEGGMIAVLGSEVEKINEIINTINKNFKCFIANDNSIGQIVVSGKTKDLDLFSKELKIENIKNIKLPVTAPSHCELMNEATSIMSKEINNNEFKVPKNFIISNVTAKPTNDPVEIKNLLIEQIEKPVRWRETVINMINSENQKFIEIGPGKVLSGLIKRINRGVKIDTVNDYGDIKDLTIN